MAKSAKVFIEHLLNKADIVIGGDRSWDITVHDERFYQRIISEGALGVGESYMDGWWDVPRLDEFFAHALRSRIDRNARLNANVHTALRYVGARLLNVQKTKAFRVGERHYDVGNDLYKLMLDKRLVYTCGYWKNASTLDEAQEAKLDLVCRKAGLAPGMKVADLGCGWGSFAKYAAEKYGVEVVGVTVSKEQVALGRELCKGLPVEIRLQDYRDLTGSFDRVISIGLTEHVGYKNYRALAQKAYDLLSDGGIFLQHTIGGNVSRINTDPWIDKYIFPGGMIPSPSQLARAAEGLFVMEDWHNFGTDYDKTLMAWWHNFNGNWKKLKDAYGDRFYRMWAYYLLSCAGAFRARELELWQIVWSKNGIPGGYTPVR